MKKYILLLCSLVTFVFPAYPDDAYDIANGFFESLSPVTRTRNGKPSKLERLNISDNRVQAFNRAGGGFVLLANIDGVWEIVGYDTENVFSTDNECSVVGYLADNDSAVAPATKIVTAGSPVKGPYLTTRWNQGEPFNRFCPYDTVACERMWAGCSTVALAQLCYYYRTPSHSTYRKFDWDKMKPDYSPGSYTDEEAAAVAALFADLSQEATCVEYTSAYYGSYGSTPLYYEGLSRISVDNEHMIDFINQADAPQILSIYNYGGSYFSHAVVMDGVDSNGFWHINWGWGGNCDGWFQPNYFKIMYNGSEITPTLRGENYQSFLNPDANCHEPSLSLTGGVSITPSNPRVGEQVTVTLHGIKYNNTSYCNFSFKDSGQSFGVFLYNPYPWRSKGAVNRNTDYEAGYVGKKYLPEGADSYIICKTKMVYHMNYSGSDINLTFNLPDFPSGKDMILRPEYYLSWQFSSLTMRKWPEGSYTLGLIGNWHPFHCLYNAETQQYYSSSYQPSSDDTQSTTCLILHKNNDGTVAVRAVSGEDLIYDYGASAGIESVAVERPVGEKHITGYYRIDGRFSSVPLEGLNIIRYSDGSSRKVIMNAGNTATH